MYGFLSGLDTQSQADGSVFFVGIGENSDEVVRKFGCDVVVINEGVVDGTIFVLDEILVQFTFSG